MKSIILKATRIILGLILGLSLFVSDLGNLANSEFIQTSETKQFEESFKCLQDNAWFEARQESKHSFKEMQLVSEVVINRANSGKYPKEVCKVVYQKYQFSWTLDKLHKNKLKKALRTPQEALKYKQAGLVAYKVLTQPRASKELSEDTLFYCTHRVNPKWIHSVKPVKLKFLSFHKFFKE